jgi:hypothetical protein
MQDERACPISEPSMTHSPSMSVLLAFTNCAIVTGRRDFEASLLCQMQLSVIELQVQLSDVGNDNRYFLIIFHKFSVHIWWYREIDDADRRTFVCYGWFVFRNQLCGQSPGHTEPNKP